MKLALLFYLYTIWDINFRNVPILGWFLIDIQCIFILSSTYLSCDSPSPVIRDPHDCCPSARYFAPSGSAPTQATRSLPFLGLLTLQPLPKTLQLNSHCVLDDTVSYWPRCDGPYYPSGRPCLGRERPASHAGASGTASWVDGRVDTVRYPAASKHLLSVAVCQQNNCIIWITNLQHCLFLSAYIDISREILSTD